MTAPRPAALSILLAAVAGCASPPPGPPPLRLTEAVSSVEAELAEIRIEPQPRLTRAAIGSVPRGVKPKLIQMAWGPNGRDYRQALIAPTPSVYRFRLALPAGDPVLEIGLGYDTTLTEPGARVEFQVGIRTADGTFATVLAEAFDAVPKDDWRDSSLPLARWAGQQVEIELRTRGGGAQAPQVLAAWSAPELRATGAQQPRWNLLLIGLDTLRADRLGCYGYHRDTSPNIDRLAARSFRFATAISQSCWTQPSHKSLFSGLYPSSSGKLNSTPLAKKLWYEGYRTTAFTGGGFMSPPFNVYRGFEAYRLRDWVVETAVVRSWLAKHLDRRFFLFLHTYDIHEPYRHAELAAGLDPGRVQTPFTTRQYKRLRGTFSDAEKAYVSALYDGGIRHSDARLGEILDDLQRLGLAESTVIAVFSDHGEEFWDHDSWGHGRYPWEHQIRVPLILHLPAALRRELGIPGDGRGVIEQQVELVDLYPTLLELLGLELDGPVQGRSLVPLLRGETLPHRDAFAEGSRSKYEAKALRSQRYKLMYGFRRGAPDSEPQLWLFDLRDDPGETRNLAEERPEITAELRGRLEALIGGSVLRPYEELDPDELDPKLREQLEALGYLGN